MRYTPLMAAASSGNPETVKFLLDHGADPKLTASDGKTALDWTELHVERVPTDAEKAVVVAQLAAAGARYMDGRVPFAAQARTAASPSTTPPPVQPAPPTVKPWWANQDDPPAAPPQPQPEPAAQIPAARISDAH